MGGAPWAGRGAVTRAVYIKAKENHSCRLADRPVGAFLTQPRGPAGPSWSHADGALSTTPLSDPAGLVHLRQCELAWYAGRQSLAFRRSDGDRRDKVGGLQRASFSPSSDALPSSWASVPCGGVAQGAVLSRGRSCSEGSAVRPYSYRR